MQAAFSRAPVCQKNGGYHPACCFSVTAVFNGVPFIVYLNRRLRSPRSLHLRLIVLSPSRALIIERRKARSFTDGAAGNFTER